MDFGNYTDIKNELSSYLGSYVDSSDSFVFPIARRVFSKTIGSDLVSIPTDDKYEGLVSYHLATKLKNLGFDWVSAFYYEEDGYEYGLRYGLYTNQDKQDENYVGIYNKYACPYFKDVLKWLSTGNNYALYANIIFNEKDYLYEYKGSCNKPLGQFFYMDYKTSAET